MTEKAYSAGDPFQLVGAVFPPEGGVDQDAVTARSVIEEYALTGAKPRDVRALFRNPEYLGTHAIWCRLGAEFVDALIDDVFGCAQRVPLELEVSASGDRSDGKSASAVSGEAGRDPRGRAGGQHG